MARATPDTDDVIDLREDGRDDEVVARDDGRGRTAEKPTEIPARGWKDVLLRVKDQTRADNVPLLAAGVAFYLLLALIPALVAIVSIYGLFADPADVQRQIEDLAAGMPAEARDLLTTQLESIVSSSRAGLSIGAVVGVVAALWSASAGVKHLISAINVAYNEDETRKLLKLRAIALVATIVFVVGVTAAFTLIAVLPRLVDDTAIGDVAKTAIEFARWPALFVLYLVGLAALYRYAPDRDNPRWHWVSWGAVVATVLWVIGSIGLSIYSANFGKFNETYGSMAAVVLLMLWLMLTAYTIVLGAELNSELEHQTAEDSTEDRPQPMGHRGAYMADTVGARKG